MRNFINGLTSLFNVFGDRRIDKIEIPNDAKALRSDWIAVGMDMKRAMSMFPSSKVTSKEETTALDRSFRKQFSKKPTRL